MKKRAFISYAHAQADWVRTFHAHLELVLGEGKVARDEFELKPGRSFISGLARSLEEAETLVLVATPEAAASSWVKREVRTKQLDDAPFEAVGRIHVVLLADTPLPDFLDDVQWTIDLRDYDLATYLQGVAVLAAALSGGVVDDFRLPDGIEAPEPPQRALPPDLRKRMVELLAAELSDKNKRHSFSNVLDVEPALVSRDAQKTTRGAASALLVHATRHQHDVLPATLEGPTRGLRAKARLLEILLEEDLVTDERQPSLRALIDDIEAHRSTLESRRGARQGTDDGSSPLDCYLEKVRRDRLYSPFLREEAAFAVLDRVYTPLAHALIEPKAPRDVERTSLPDACTLRELITQPLPKTTQSAHRWSILGDPGSGKTTQMRRLALDLANDPDASWIPVFARLPRWMAAEKDLLAWVAEEARVGVDRARVEAALREAAAAGQVVFLLDGLDEVPKDDREQAVTDINALADQWPSPIVVSSRHVGKAPLGGDFAEVKVLPLDRAKQIEFLTCWFEARGDRAGQDDRTSESRAITLVDSLERDDDLEKLASNPLYLTFIALLDKGGETLEGGRAALYNRVLDLLRLGKHRPHLKPIDEPDLVERVLQRLACHLTKENRDGEDLGPLRRRLRKDEKAMALLDDVKHWRDDTQTFLDDVSERTNILGPHDGAEEEWRFWHRTLREALTAQVLKQQYECEGIEPVLARATKLEDDDKNAWAEPIALVAGQIDAPDPLILSLAESHADVALRALGAVRSLAPETLETLFHEAFRGKWWRRSQICQRIPTLVADPSHAIDLIDALRKRTRDGNDFFLLDRAAASIGKRLPDAAANAEALRARFFDHIPMPEEAKLFRSLVRLDGRSEDLWCRIKPDVGVIGSREGEGGKDELPRHRVEVVAPYWLSAVPITREQYSAFDSTKQMHRFEGIKDAELDHHPAIAITWYEAMAFCRWLDLRLGFKGARLPTEEEWEYACRAGTETAFWCGDDEGALGEVAWFDKGYGDGTAPVGERRENDFGLYDVHGNVWEWTCSPFEQDRYAGRTLGSPLALDPRQRPADLAAPPGVRRVVRGGSYWDAAARCRSACRDRRDPGIGIWDQGFRVLLPRPPETLDP